jgi:hypothetical protein
MPDVLSFERPALGSRIQSGPCFSIVLPRGSDSILTIGQSPYADHD